VGPGSSEPFGGGQMGRYVFPFGVEEVGKASSCVLE